VSTVNCTKPSSALCAEKPQGVIASHLEELSSRPYLTSSDEMVVTSAATADIQPPASDRPYMLLSTRWTMNAGAVEWSNKTEVAPVDLPVAHPPETKSCDRQNVALIQNRRQGGKVAKSIEARKLVGYCP
jgi:hypothetical protein